MSEPARTDLSLGRGYAFGPFTIDLVRRLLWHDGQVVPLTAKAFDVLAALIENRDHVMTKDDLLQRVWHGTFVQENNLVRHVSMVRRCLGQRPEQHDFIVTVPGVGYRFVSPLTEIDLPEGLPTTATLECPRPCDMADRSAAPTPEEVGPVPARATPWEAPGPIAGGAPSTVSAGSPVLAPERIIESQVSPAGPTHRPWILRAAAWSSAAILALLASGTVFLRSTDVSANRLLRQLTYGPDVQLNPTWSPDGTAFAFSSNRSGDFEIWVQTLENPEPIQVTSSPRPDWRPAWSPDGRMIAFRSERNGGGLFVVSVGGESLQRLSDFGYNPRWSPDGARLLFQSSLVQRARPRPFVVDLSAGSMPVAARSDVAQSLTNSSVAWHPDGALTFWGRRGEDWVMVKAALEDAGATTTYVLSRKQAAELRDLGLTLTEHTWAKGGDYLYFEGHSHEVQNLWRVAVAPSNLEWRGAPERVTLGAGADGHVTLSSDGSKLAFSSASERTRLWAFPLGSHGRAIADAGTPLTSGGSGEYDASVSPDGQFMLYRTVRVGRQELWRRPLAAGPARLLIAGTNTIRSSPRISRDSARFAYSLARTGADGRVSRSVAILERDGSERSVTAPGTLGMTPSDWSPDGNRILGLCMSVPETGRAGVCEVATTPNSKVRVIYSNQTSDFYSAWYSPNGRWISVVERTAKRENAIDWTGAIAVIPATGGPLVRVTDGRWNDEKPRWSADGRTLYFVSNRGGFVNVWARRFNPESGLPEGEPYAVTDFNDLHYYLPTDMGRVEISIVGNVIYLPLTEMSGTIWSLEGLGQPAPVRPTALRASAF